MPIKTGIRSYGPGKFIKIIDSYVYELTLDGGADREEGSEGDGWYGFVEITPDVVDRINEIAKEEKDQLTGAEGALLDDTSVVILCEREDGIVEADWFTGFDGKTKAEAAWKEIESEFEDVDDDDEDDDDDDEDEDEFEEEDD